MLPWPERVRNAPSLLLRAGLPARKRPIIIVGSSHTHAVAKAIEARGDRDIGVLHIPAREAGKFGAPLLARYQPRVAVSMLRGNEHHVFAMLEHEEPFDFHLPEARGVIEGRRIVPLAEVRAALASSLARTLEGLDLIMQRWAVPTMHLASPPPLERDEDIAPALASLAPRRGVVPRLAPASVRAKVYVLRNQIVREHCLALGVRFVPPPGAAVSPRGFLRRSFWSSDPTHANTAYGYLVLEQIDDFAAEHSVPRTAPLRRSDENPSGPPLPAMRAEPREPR